MPPSKKILLFRTCTISKKNPYFIKKSQEKWGSNLSFEHASNYK